MSMYIQRLENCQPIEYPKFTIREMLGEKNGNSPAISIAVEEFAPTGASPVHYHKKASECQLVLEGEGVLRVGSRKVKVTAGDLVKIPPGMVHQTTNKGSIPLKLLCLVSKAWNLEDTVFEDKVSKDEGEIYVRRQEGCAEVKGASGETIYELVGKTNGAFENFSVAMVKIEAGHASDRHFHEKGEESYLIMKGEGRINIDGEEKVLTPGDLVKIGAGKVHQIFSSTPLEFYCVCTPAWTFEDMKKV